MAEAFARHLGSDVIEASSAGTRPAAKLNPTVVDVMKERAIDLSEKMPRMLTQDVLEEADLVVTMGCSVQEVCPAPMAKHSIDWKLEDPCGKSEDEVRRIRDEVEGNVRQLITRLRAGEVSHRSSEHSK
jgi:arsenate reductase